MSAGSNVVVVGSADVPGTTHIHNHTGAVGAEIARNVVIIEHFVAALAN